MQFMGNRFRYIYLFLLAQLIFVSGACSGRVGTPELSVSIDSICSLMSGARYSSVVSLDSLADELSRFSNQNNETQMIFSNAKAYASMMDMDYAKADTLYTRVLNESFCEIERLVAAVGLMTLDYRVSANRRFFDHRTVALELIRRINEDVDYLSATDRERFERAKVEFGIVSICYFANLGMLEEKQVALKYLKSNLEVVKSVPLRVYGRMIVANNTVDAKERLSSLLLGLNVSNSYSLKWLQANYKLLLAITLRDSRQREMLVKELPDRFEMFSLHNIPLENIPIALSHEAKADFEEYGDRYMMTEAMVVAASCNIQSGDYDDALVLLDSALVVVNGYYGRTYPDSVALCSNSLLYLNDSVDFVTDASVGMYNIPECLLSIRREASSAYAGLHDKVASDINREGYLELLRTTRMNKKFESRASSAEEDAYNLQLWIMALVAILVVVIIFLYITYRARTSYERSYAVDRKRMLEVCRSLISSLPHEVPDKTMLCKAITDMLDSSLGDFSGNTSFEIVGDGEVVPEGNACLFDIHYMNHEPGDILKVTSSIPLSPEKHIIISMAVPYIAVAIEEGMRLAGMSEEQERLEEQRRAYELYLAEHKREYLQKRVSLSVVSAMRPFMDRLLKELHALPGNLQSGDEERKLRYIDELTGKLDDLNVILERWIKMRHGELNLQIENFAVSDLFSIIGKSAQLIGSHGVRLDVMECSEVVKADKALTLFMLNTLVDNATKFTPSGGTITVGCDVCDSYVELFVSDTGIGISKADIDRILGEKVYDASRIGEDNARLQPKSKGGGFGLMNCKGIIEKYRKTDGVFSVCSMDIESSPGKGSRFSFRLPKGVMRLIAVLLMLVPSSLYASDDLFLRLGESVDSVYMSNVNGNYEEAFVQARHALALLNEYYILEVGGSDTLTLTGGNAAELSWWRGGVFPDELKEDIYFNILDVRNEIAVASLALQRWQSYRYNNYIYSTLYRLVHEDTGIAERYESLRQGVNVRQAAVALLCFLLLVLLVYTLLSYVRFNVMERMNERMVIDVNERLLHVATGDERVSVQELADSLLHEFYSCVGENMRMERVAMVLYDAAKNQFMAEKPHPVLHGRADIYMYSVLENGEDYISPDGLLRVMPLCAIQAGESHMVGVLEIVTERPLGENEAVTLELVTDYLASVAFHAVVRVESRYLALEEMEEDAARIKFEENRLHVKNLVMDNCLSVIKHETIYYPSRVRELAGVALADKRSRSASVESMRELMEYYSSVFGILSNCAMRELNEMNLAISQRKLSDLFDYAVAYLSRRCRKNGLDLSLSYEPTDAVVAVDVDIAMYLFESLLDAAMKVGTSGVLQLRAAEKSEVVSVELVDARVHLASDEVAELFTPTERNIVTGGLVGMEYLVAKEIVRLHEDYTGKYGGRMEARSDVSGTIIHFTLPK